MLVKGGQILLSKSSFRSHPSFVVGRFKMKSALCAFALVVSVTPAGAAPLEFAGINAQTVAPDPATMTCMDLGPIYAPHCSLSRSSFGGVHFDSSSVLLNNKTRRVSRIMLSFANLWADSALKALTAKYGAPSKIESKPEVNKQGGPYTRKDVSWEAADKDGKVWMMTGDSTTVLGIDFTANREPEAAPKVDF